MPLVSIYKPEELGMENPVLEKVSINKAFKYIKSEVLENLEDYEDFFDEEIDMEYNGPINVLKKNYKLSNLIKTTDRSHYNKALKEFLLNDLNSTKEWILGFEDGKGPKDLDWYNYMIKVHVQVYEQLEFDFMKTM